MAMIDIPAAESGPWRVEHFSVTEDQSREEQRVAELVGDPRWTPPGEYTALKFNGVTMMSDVPTEIEEHAEVLEQARARGGRCLVHGLGLGLIVRDMLACDRVEHIDVVELDEHVLRLVVPSLREAFPAPAGSRLTVHHDNCFTKTWPADKHWTVVWHDIWLMLVESNLPEMGRLHERFASMCDWQESWGRKWLVRRKGQPSTARAESAYMPDESDAIDLCVGL